MNFEELFEIVSEEVEGLKQEYQICQGMILTEDDLKCNLFARLKPRVPTGQRTINPNVVGSALHSEVKFFDEDNKLTLRPDLCIIDPMHMSIYHSVEFEVTRKTAKFKSYSSKKFEIGGSAILIEFKYCRNPEGPTRKEILDFKKDLDKLVRLQTIVSARSDERDKIYGVFVFFNKTNKNKEAFDNLLPAYNENQNLKAMYASGNVDFAGVNPKMFGSGYLMEDNAIC
jgi:hypothetical protein